MKLHLMAIIACTALIAGCETKLRWRDETGQDRAQSIADADLKACKAQIVLADSRLTEADWEVVWATTKTCMAAKGWAPITHRNSN